MKPNFKLRNKKILVTGGAGFIGSNLCEYLLNSDAIVSCLDNFSTGNQDNIRQAASQVDQKMREIGGKSPNLSTSDVAILAAMYIFDEYSSSTVGESSFKGRIESRVESLIERIDQAI